MQEKINLSVTCSNYELAIKLIDLNVDNIIIGLKNFSTRFNDYFSLEEIEKICNNKKNTKISICLNIFFFEQDILKLEIILIALSKLNIDSIIFNDYAIAQIVYEKNLKLNLHYNSETLNVNYGQIDFFSDNKINKITLANELTIQEIKKIAQNKKDVKLEIQIFGLGFIMYSRWNMISSYVKKFNYSENLFKDIKFLFIREDLRTNPVILFEDLYGTHMLTGFLICGIKKINFFKQEKIDFLKIDSLFLEDNILIEIIKIFIFSIRNDLNENELSNLYKKIELLSPYKVSENFFNFPKGLLHMEKIDE